MVGYPQFKSGSSYCDCTLQPRIQNRRRHQSRKRIDRSKCDIGKVFYMVAPLGKRSSKGPMVYGHEGNKSKWRYSGGLNMAEAYFGQAGLDGGKQRPKRAHIPHSTRAFQGTHKRPRQDRCGAWAAALVRLLRLTCQPLIKQTDGQGNSTDHGIIYGIPVSRSQGGGSAIINDPKVGDIGHMSIFGSRQSALKANQGKTSTPGSQRMS